MELLGQFASFGQVRPQMGKRLPDFFQISASEHPCETEAGIPKHHSLPLIGEEPNRLESRRMMIGGRHIAAHVVDERKAFVGNLNGARIEVGGPLGLMTRRSSS